MSHCSSCYNKITKKPIICASCGGLLCKICRTHSLPAMNTTKDKLVVCDKCYSQQAKNNNKTTQDFALPNYLQIDPGKVREQSYYSYTRPQDTSSATVNESYLPIYLQPETQGQNTISSGSTHRKVISKTTSGLSLDILEPPDQDIVNRLEALKGGPPGGTDPPNETELRERLDKLRGFSVENAYLGGKTDFPLRVTMRPGSNVPEDDLAGQVIAENEFKSHLIRSYTMPDKEFEDRRKMFQQDPTLLDEIEMIDLMDDLDISNIDDNNNCDNSNKDFVKSKPSNWYNDNNASNSFRYREDTNFNLSVEQLILQTVEEVKNDRLIESVKAKVDFELYDKFASLCPFVTPYQLQPLSPSRLQNTAWSNDIEDATLQDEDALQIMLNAIGYSDSTTSTTTATTTQDSTTTRESLFDK